MILLFPNLETLQLALTSGIVPADVTLAPATVSYDDQGKIYVESTANLTRTITKNLDRIGVKGSKRHASDSPADVSCWPQLIPLTRETTAPTLSNQAPVLFELSDSDDLPTLVTEMLRLGNDRQSFRWFAESQDPDSRRVLLRVIGPPYYTLLRALDPSGAGTKGTVRAYFERAPRVWLEVGFTHPLAAQIRVAEQQLLLLRSPREWVYLDEAPFQDVYDILQFKLPSAPVGWTETEAPKKMSVPIRLTAGNAADAAELWVLRENGVEQLDALVRDSDDRLLQRLMFAVATDAAGNRSVILRTRPSKLAPPHLPLEKALSFKPYWKLPNLFVPIGRRLHPTLRRDAVRKLMADDADTVVWLYPGEGGAFTPEGVPDSAFRSLEDWVDYVIEAEQKPLAAWIDATRFDFDHFICTDTGGPKPKPDKGEKDPRAGGEETRVPKGPAPRTVVKGKADAARPAATAEFALPPEVVKPPSEWRIRREALEKDFLEAEGSLDAPPRVAMWPELAAANAGEGQKVEAGICWLNALWGADPMPAQWLAGWLRSELQAGSLSVKAEEFDRRLAPTSGQEEARIAIASFLWLASQDPVPAWLSSRLAVVQTYLEKHESALPVRAVWLAAYRLSQLAGADVLGLARVRDRLLQRLLEQGLQAERDLPMFLRVAGHKDSERLRVVRDRAAELHQAVRKWTEHIPQNLPYVDLYFAYAMAKLQETSRAKQLIEDARLLMQVPIPATRNQAHDELKITAAIVSNYLFKAIKFRVEQVLAGRPRAGELAPELLVEFDEIHKKSSDGPINNPYKLAHYVISRMRDQSHILEPHEKLDPYAEFTKSADPLKRELTELHAIRDPRRLGDRIRKLHRDGPQGRSPKEVQFLILHETLPLGPRVGEGFTVELIQLVPAALAGVMSSTEEQAAEFLKKQGELVSRSLFLAGHFDRRDLVVQLVDEFSRLIHGKKEEERFKLMNVVGGECMRSLKRLGMRDEMDRFFTNLHNEILRGGATGDLRKRYSSRTDMWSAVLQTQLNLAGGWLNFGLVERAKPILDDARTELITSAATKFEAKQYTDLARAYVTALGYGPAESGLARIIELFRMMDPKKINNTFTTAPHYSRFHLNLVEDTVRAIISDDFALGSGGRKWLDDDEYLVRRRIHADMRRHLDRSGL